MWSSAISFLKLFWEGNWMFSTGASDVHVSSLRKKLGPKYQGIERIQSIRGVGYIYSLPEEES